jgi:hypothetical protein
MTVFSVALPRMRFTHGLVRIQCKTKADVPYFSQLPLEYSLRALIAARRLRRMFDIVHSCLADRDAGSELHGSPGPTVHLGTGWR